MAQPVGVTLGAVVDAAAALIDREGLEGLTLTRVAGLLGIRTPSLYAHLNGIDDLRRRLALRGVTLLRKELVSAVDGLEGRDALAAVAATYGSFAARHPGLYAATLRDPGEDAELRDANEATLAVFIGVLRTFELPEAELMHAYRAYWSALHGFNLLVATGVMTMPPDAASSYERIVDIFAAYFAGASTSRRSVGELGRRSSN